MTQQQQFLNVIDRDEAERRFHAALDLRPLSAELVPISAALGRVLAEDIRSSVNVPSFDRANVDGYALRAADTVGASELNPRRLKLANQTIAPGIVPQGDVASGSAISIA